MYFTPEAQTQILANFHFALREDGFLFLGKSEVLSRGRDLFEAVDLKRRVFAKVPHGDGAGRRRATSARRSLDAAPVESTIVRDAGLRRRRRRRRSSSTATGRLALANLQARMQFGLAQRDLGRPIQDLELSFRPVELRSRIEQAYADGHAVVAPRRRVAAADDETRYLDVQVAPLRRRTGERRRRRHHVHRRHALPAPAGALQEARHDAETAYEELQATVEELETTNEELQSTNEELETTNEELQSTNEELETMNEELAVDERGARDDERRAPPAHATSSTTANAFLESILGEPRRRRSSSTASCACRRGTTALASSGACAPTRPSASTS